jgi:hypothetical protein
MLVAIFVGIFSLFGGSGVQFGELMTQYTKDPIKTHIADKDRREAALKELSVMGDDIKELNKQVSKDLKQFEKLIKDYDSKPEDFDGIFATALTKRQTEVETLWSHRADLLQHIHADEWQAIMVSANTAMAKDSDNNTK